MHYHATVLLFGAYLVSAAHACDSCAIAIATGEGNRGFIGSVSEQFTHLGTLRLDGEEVPNETGQYLDSSTTHFNLGYSDGDRLTLQLILPYLHRAFRRPTADGIENGTESGLGDIVAGAHYIFARHVDTDSSWELGALAGIKFATGSPDRIAEELNEDEGAGGEPSGIHGHDLALGSGSTDAVAGLEGRWASGRFFLNGAAQYSIRTTGSYDYRYANEWLWSVAPGWYAKLNHESSLALAAVLSGEDKPQDTFAGETAEDTGLRAIYLGPRVTYTSTDRWSVEIEFAWPLSQHNTALQAVADYRWRVGAMLRF